MKEREMDVISELIDKVLKSLEDERLHSDIKEKVKALCKKFPFYSRIYKI
jgi:glycine hydroxymethyltransferase